MPALVSTQNLLNNTQSALLLSSDESVPIENIGFPVFETRKQKYGRFELSKLPVPYDRPDVVVFHDTYIPLHALIAKSLCKKRIPYVITPRGGMTYGAQSVKRLKKIVGNKVFFNYMVRNALALHCLTKNEAIDAESWKRPIFIVGNGTEIPTEEYVASPGQSDTMRFVFIGRLEPYHKGLDVLLNACSIIKSELANNGAKVELYGSGSRDNLDNLKNTIAQFNLDDVVELNGPIVREEKAKLLKEADVFVHTSRFEGHPMSVLEALAYGVPCLLTPGTNMSTEVTVFGAGWEAQSVPQSISNVMIRILSQKKQLKNMGQKARKLANEKYSWEQVARDSVDEYQKCLQRPQAER